MARPSSPAPRTRMEEGRDGELMVDGSGFKDGAG